MKKSLSTLKKQRKTLMLLTILSVALYFLNPLMHVDAMSAGIETCPLALDVEPGTGGAEVYLKEFVKEVISSFFTI